MESPEAFYYIGAAGAITDQNFVRMTREFIGMDESSIGANVKRRG